MTIPIQNKAKFNEIWELLFTGALHGIRTYYSEPTIEYDLDLNQNIVTVFRVKQKVLQVTLEDLRDLEFPEKVRFRAGDEEDKNYLRRFCNEIQAKSRITSKQPFSSRFTYMWPASPFEEWLEEEHDSHWITANWFASETKSISSESYYIDNDYAVILSVKAPLTCSIQEYEDRYGSAFILTKLTI